MPNEYKKICNMFTDNKYATQYYLDTSGAQLKRAKLNSANGNSDKTRRNKTSKRTCKKRSKRHDRIEKQTDTGINTYY